MAGPSPDDGEPVVQGDRVTISDPVELLLRLEAGGRFHRDSWFGRLFHPGRVSLRETSPTDSLHVVVHGDHLAAHVDKVSPLGRHESRRSPYSLRRAAAHNLSGMAHDMVRLVRGRQGDHRCELDCEWLRDPARLTPADTSDLLDPVSASWSVQLEARVSGRLDPSRLRQAVEALSGRRPPNGDPLDVVECRDEASLESTRAELQQRPAAATDWPPFRAMLAQHPAGDMLMLNLNHAAADGVGALKVLAAIARAYRGGSEPQEPADFLTTPDLPVRPAASPVPVLRAHYRTAVERTRDLLARPAQLAEDQPADTRTHGFHQVRLSAEDTSRLVDPERPGTSRRLLLAGLHLAVGEWNRLHGARGRRVGVLVPVDLRPPGWRDEPVANFTVTARVSTSPRHRTDPRSVLDAIVGQGARNRRARTGVALLSALERSNLLPLWGKQSRVVLQPLTGNRLVDTAILANLGALEEPPWFGDDAGDTVELWFSAPARGPRTLCLGAVTVAGRLCLTLRYPRRVLGADAARRFVDCYLAQLGLVAAALHEDGGQLRTALT